MFPSSKWRFALASCCWISLVACDSSSNSVPAAEAPRSCDDYVCHWAGIDSSESTTTLEGIPLRVYDTLHLELAADSSYRDWHVEAAYSGTTRYGLKPSRVATGTWRLASDSLHFQNGESRYSLHAILASNILTLYLPRDRQSMVFTPR